jgi:glycosyltransferase involved in cell wall biosynthesis
MAQWTLRAPYAPLFLLGPVLETDCYDYAIERDIDVLFIARKSTKYLRDYLVPALKEKCNVHTLNGFVTRQELFQLYNRSRVYLYSSDLTEGFGFQPLEALMCGCAVFSNLHGGLADYLEPEMNAFKLESYSLQYDVARVLKVLEDGWTNSDSDVAGLRTEYSEEAFHRRVQRILPALNAFFPHAESSYADIPRLIAESKTPAWRLAVYRNRKHAGNRLRTMLASKP